MIDFKTKTLYFGYGDIDVGNMSIGLTFREFKPPLKVGTVLTDDVKNEMGLEYTSDIVSVYLCSYEEAMSLDKLLNRMLKEGTFQFTFKEWVFNFSNWNSKSVECIKAHLNIVRSNMLMCMAC